MIIYSILVAAYGETSNTMTIFESCIPTRKALNFADLFIISINSARAGRGLVLQYIFGYRNVSQRLRLKSQL